MRLKDWLVETGRSPSSFAKEIGLPSSTIVRIVADGRAGTHAVMERIIRGSRGAVLPNDFFDIQRLSGGA